MLDSINETVKEQLEKVKDTFSAAAEKVTDLKDAGAEKVSGYLNELSNGLPIIEAAGFNIDSINIEMGLPPLIFIVFDKTNEVKAGFIEELIEQHKDKKILTAVLKALEGANYIQQKITLNKFIFSGVIVKLGIPPSVTLKYK